MRGLDAADHKFLVHLGSATRAVDACKETAYYRTQLSLSVSPVPVYSVPGNNDYPVCPNPALGWEHYEDHMMNIDTMYWNVTEDYDVKRQLNEEEDSTSNDGIVGNMENFSFLYKRVLFIGLNTVTNEDSNGSADSTIRSEGNVNWIEQNTEAYRDTADAVFVMGYGRLLATENIPFYDAMVSMSKNALADKLLVYARRSATTDIDKNVGGAKNFMELRVGSEWPIMDVRVRTTGAEATVSYRDAITEEAAKNDEDV